MTSALRLDGRAASASSAGPAGTIAGKPDCPVDFGSLLEGGKQEIISPEANPPGREEKKKEEKPRGEEAVVLSLWQVIPSSPPPTPEPPGGTTETGESFLPPDDPAVLAGAGTEPTEGAETGKEGAKPSENTSAPIDSLLVEASGSQDVASDVDSSEDIVSTTASSPSGKDREPRGIAAAQQNPMPLNGAKQEESTAPVEHKVPLSGWERVSFAVPVEIARPFPAGWNEPARNRFDEKMADGGALIPGAAIEPLPLEAETVGEAAPVVPVRQLAEAIQSHVRILSVRNQEAMEVVLRPDGQTQLHLQVEKVAGEIFVRARCESGDFGNLQAHWTTIRETLAAQGIRVEALENATGTNGGFHPGSGGGFSRQAQQAAPDEIASNAAAPRSSRLRAESGPVGAESSNFGVAHWQRWA